MSRRWPVICCLVVVAGAAAAAGGAEGWRLASQAYTFRSLTFFETVDTLASIGVKYVEAYPGQRIGGGVAGKTHHTMDEETRDKVLAKLKEAGVKLACYGVVSGRDEADWRKIFEFARATGIETITSEPGPAHMDLLDKLCEEYNINIAIHNHPKASRYWNPDTVLEAVRGRSKRIGACADTGHWVRSGLDPLECLKQLEGRIVSLHFKDLNEKGRRAHDVPWGTGACGADAMLAELRRQGFKGVFSIEYEHNTPELTDNVRKCVDYFRIWSAEMVADVAEVWKGLKPDATGRWPEGGPGARPVADAASNVTKGYIDTTDDRKGKITACGPGFPREGPDKVFDNSTRSKFCIEMTAIWIQHQYADGARHRITAYAIASANDNPGRDPRDWKLLGSNDGESWDVVDKRSGQRFPSRFQKRLFEVKRPAEYNYYKLDIARNHGDVSSQVSEFELLVKKEEPGPPIAEPKGPEEVATAAESRTPEVAAKTEETPSPATAPETAALEVKPLKKEEPKPEQTAPVVAEVESPPPEAPEPSKTAPATRKAKVEKKPEATSTLVYVIAAAVVVVAVGVIGASRAGRSKPRPRRGGRGPGRPRRSA